MEEWMRGRNSPIPDATPESLNAKLDVVVRSFGVEWLNKKDDNPIQLLWKRNDGFATSELLILGDAIEKLEAIDSAWVAKRVHVAMSRKSQDRIGDLFELVGLGMLCTNGQTVIPAKKDQPGFDGTVQLRNGPKLYLSMKNHDVSRHEEHFQTWSDRVAKKFAAKLESQRLNGLNLVAFAREYPQEGNWQALVAALPEILGTDLLTFRSQPYSDGFWTLRLMDVPFNDSLAVYPISHQTTIVSPYHKNEKLNLFSQISSATANFQKHATQYSDKDSIRCLFLRVSATASVTACQQWCREYFADTPSTTIDIILIYQVSILTILPENGPAIIHRFGLELKPGCLPFTGPDGSPCPPQFQTFIGRFSASDSKLLIAGTDIQLSDSYLFQRGDVYRLMETRAAGDHFGEMKHVADGIRVHAVLQSVDSSFTISGKFPESHRLLLFS